MENYVALLGMLLLWASVIWLPVTVYRAKALDGQAKAWALSSIFGFFMVLFGFTRAMAEGSATILVWSIAWAMPIGLALYLRASAPNVPVPGWDKWMGAVVLITFLPMIGILPGILRQISAAIW